MSWTGNPEALPTSRIAAVLPGLQASERRVMELILAETAAVVESTAQELADRAGVGRTTVIRACQGLGYRGYPQLRVALARELAHLESRGESEEFGSDALGRIRADIARTAAALPAAVSVLHEDDVEAAVAAIVAAPRVLVVGNGLSAGLAADTVMRLSALGVRAEWMADPIGQQIAAAQLAAGEVCLLLSASGTSESTLKAARAARRSAATTIAVTSFARAPLAGVAETSLVLADASGFQAELEMTSRVAHVLLMESLVRIVGERLGERARAARALVYEVLSDNLDE